MNPSPDVESDLDLVGQLPETELVRNGVPEPGTARRRKRLSDAVRQVLGSSAVPADVSVSPLGPAWETDVDVYLGTVPDVDHLLSSGWLPLDGLLARLGSRGSGRWTALEDGDVLGAVDLHVGREAPDPVERVLRRCRRRGEVRLREVLELRRLAMDGTLRPSASSAALLLAARVEAGLGGHLLDRWNDHRRPYPAPPAPLPGVARLRAAARRGRQAVQPRVVVALSGVDGAGKSTLNAALRSQLERAGVPASTVWARPGNRLGFLDALARVVKSVSRQDPTPGVFKAATGETGLASRTGIVGLVWATLITGAFLRDAWVQHLRGTGVVIWDRHVLDALATLDFAYAGVEATWLRWLVRRALPEAYLTVYLDVPLEVAVARKPGDIFADYAVGKQLESYRRLLADTPDVLVIDATQPVLVTTEQVLRTLTGTTEQGRPAAGAAG